MAFPEHIDSEKTLIDRMITPSNAVRAAVSKLDGDVIILGAGGKMGPTLAGLLVRAGARRVIGVSRFTDKTQQRNLLNAGVETIRADLLDTETWAKLPDAPYIYILAGFKFGATGNEAATWAMNAWLPGMIVKRYSLSRIVYVSSGNVYAYVPVNDSGANEQGKLGPVGEYAQSRLGGERIATCFSDTFDTPLTIVRLFYATELRYGIIHDLAWKIYRQEPIDLSMGHVNQIWQGDANAYLARLMPLCANPPTVINMTGNEILSVRNLAEKLGALLDRTPVFIGKERDTALLGDASKLSDLFGPPCVSADQIIAWMAHWIKIGGPSLGKPTKYESRTGEF